MPDPATHDRYIEHEIQVLAQFVSLARTREVAPLALAEDGSKAANYLIRSRLMLIIDRFINVNGFTQQKAAEFFGTTQPRICDLVKGRIEKFSIDMLIEMVEKAGWSVDFDVTQKKVA